MQGYLRPPCVVFLRGSGGAPHVLPVRPGEAQALEKNILDQGAWPEGLGGPWLARLYTHA